MFKIGWVVLVFGLLTGCASRSETVAVAVRPAISSYSVSPVTKIEKDPEKLECITTQKLNLDDPRFKKSNITYIYEYDKINTCFIDEGALGKHVRDTLLKGKRRP